MKKIIKPYAPQFILTFYNDNKRVISTILRLPKPATSEYKRKNIVNYQKKHGFTTFVETGTYRGDTVAAVSSLFKNIYSIELDEVLFVEAGKRFAENTKVNIIRGDSGEVLTDVLRAVHESVIFWLDGHYSGGVTAKGNLNCPIYKELSAIYAFYLREKLPFVILIDDARCFDGTSDYPKIKDLKNYLQEQYTDIKIKVVNDIISCEVGCR